MSAEPEYVAPIAGVVQHFVAELPTVADWQWRSAGAPPKSPGFVASVDAVAELAVAIAGSVVAIVAIEPTVDCAVGEQPGKKSELNAWKTLIHI